MGASTIYLIRHAGTALNAARVVQLPDTPLSDHGLWLFERVSHDRRRRTALAGPGAGR